MIKGFTFTLGALAALVLVFLAVVFLGASLPEIKQSKQAVAAEVLAGYELALATLRQEIRQTPSHTQRAALRPGIDSLYANWEKDREKCAEVMPHDRIYKIDDQLAELDNLTRP